MGNPADISYEKIIDAIKLYIKESKEIVERLKSIREKVESFRKDTNIVKTVGTGFGIGATIATAGLLFAPLTGGLSLIATGTAIGGSVGSVGFSILSSFIDSNEGKKAKENIINVQSDCEKINERLEKEMKKLGHIINELTSQGIDLDCAVISTFAFLINSARSGKAVYDSVKIVKEITNSLAIGNIQKILAPTGITITRRFASGLSTGGYSVVFPSIEAVRGLNEAQQAAFNSLRTVGPEALLGPTITFVGKVMFVSSVFLTIVDLGLLINSWTTDHPLIKPLDDFLDKIESSIKGQENQLKTIETIFGKSK